MKKQPSTHSILVLGAGELGMAVLRSLARRASQHAQVTVHVLLRESTIGTDATDKKQQLAELCATGIEPVAGDVIEDSITTLAEIFAGFDTVISCIGFSAGRGTQYKLTQAALEANVARYLPWQFGVDYDAIGRGSAQDLFDEQLDVRELLRGQTRTEWIIISTGMFTSFLFEPVLGAVDIPNNTVHALGDWDTQVTVTTPEDIGRLTAEIVFFEPYIRNEVVFVAGETLSYRQLADYIDEMRGARVERIAWPESELKAALERNPDGAIEKYRAVFAAGHGVAWPEESTFNARQNIATTDVKSWMNTNWQQNIGPGSE